MTIDGVQYYEKKELENGLNDDGVKMYILSHLRSIGDRAYRVNQKILDGVFQDKTIQSTMAEDEIADFKEDWEENWHPSTHPMSIMNAFFPFFSSRDDDFII